MIPSFIMTLKASGAEPEPTNNTSLDPYEKGYRLAGSTLTAPGLSRPELRLQVAQGEDGIDATEKMTFSEGAPAKFLPLRASSSASFPPNGPEVHLGLSKSGAYAGAPSIVQALLLPTPVDPLAEGKFRPVSKQQKQMKRETLLLATQFITSLVPTNDPLDSCAQEMWESSRKLAEIELNVIREPALATSSKLRSIFDVVVHIPDSIIPEGDLYSFRQRCQRILDLPSSPRQGFAHENTHPAITSTMQSTKCLSTGTLAPLNPIIPAPLPSSSYSSVPPPHRSENGSGTAKQPHWQFHQPNYTKRGRADVSEAHDGGAKRLKQ